MTVWVRIPPQVREKDIGKHLEILRMQRKVYPMTVALIIGAAIVGGIVGAAVVAHAMNPFKHF